MRRARGACAAPIHAWLIVGTGNKVVDLYLGTKVNLLSHIAGPGGPRCTRIVKLPTGMITPDSVLERPTCLADLIVSKEIAQFFEVATFAGYEIRGNPSDRAPNGSYRGQRAWPSVTQASPAIRGSERGPSDEFRATLTDDPVVGADGSSAALRVGYQDRTRATGGVTYHMPADSSWARVELDAPRYWDWQMRTAITAVAAISPARSRGEPERPVTAAIELPEPVAVCSRLRRRRRTGSTAAAPPRAGSAGTESYTFATCTSILTASPARRGDVGARRRRTRDAGGSNPQYQHRGHTCNIGQPNQHRAGRPPRERRQRLLVAAASPSRLRMASFGKRIRSANAHEDTRRLNRRVALVVSWSHEHAGRSHESTTGPDLGAALAVGACGTAASDPPYDTHSENGAAAEAAGARPVARPGRGPPVPIPWVTIPGHHPAVSFTSSVASDTSAVEDAVTADSQPDHDRRP